jgi:hypothetical protein
VSDRKPASDGGLSLQTLLISSASPVIATVVVSQFWEAGTLFFTAFVPVTIAVVSEVLRRPAQKITEVAPLVAPRIGAPRPRPEPADARDPGPAPRPDGAGDTPPRSRAGARDDPFGLYTPQRPSVLSGRAVRIGLITGLLAFLIGAAVVTASELALFDNSIGSRERRTTLVGGSSKSSKRDVKPAPTPRSVDPIPGAAPEVSRTPGAGATPSATPSVSPTTTPTPSPGAGAPTPTPAPSGGAQSP